VEGEVVLYRIFDLGGSVDAERVRRSGHLPGDPMGIRVSPEKAMPRYISFPEPILLAVDEIVVETNLGPRRFEVVAKLFGLGAVSFSLRTRFAVGDLMELRPFADLTIQEEGRSVSLEEYTGRLFRRIREGLRPYLQEPYEAITSPEPYVVYCITKSVIPPEEWGLALRAEVAALLANEPHPKRLSRAEVEETWKWDLSYYRDDRLVVEWDAALLVEPSGRYEDVLAVLELANLQLLQLRAHDQYLDRILEKAYDDVDLLFSRRGLLVNASRMRKELGEAEMDLAEMTDASENISKLFGEWYLAKVYLACKDKLKVESWISTVKGKQAALSRIYGMAEHEVEARRLLVLEALIVMLFVLDIVLFALP
jgi:hypothetical protein